MSYFRSKQWGELAVTLQTTGGAASGGLPNYGVSILASATAEKYVLAPPFAGVEKTIVMHDYTTGAQFQITGSTTGAGTVTFMAKTTNLTFVNANAIRSTHVASVVQLKGINSTQWLITNAWPPCAVTTASTVTGGVITLTST